MGKIKGLNMKTLNIAVCFVMTLFLAFVGISNAQGQGTITFDHPLFGGTNYSQLGMRFGVVIPTHGTGSPSYDGFVVDNGSYEPTGLYMLFYQQHSPDDYVTFGLTNGYTFGLTSVDLADPNYPSTSLVPIMFIGSLANGSTVTNTFTTPGNNATTFLNYSFDSTFISGLSSVAIQAPRWAMDNLVFGNVAPVPEPGAGNLLLLGLLSLKLRRREKRGKYAQCVKITP
jgi:hypothetical protein